MSMAFPRWLSEPGDLNNGHCLDELKIGTMPLKAPHIVAARFRKTAVRRKLQQRVLVAHLQGAQVF